MVLLVVLVLLTAEVCHIKACNYRKRDATEATAHTIAEPTSIPDDGKYSATVKLLGRLDTIELLRISLESWPEINCICIKSAPMADHIDGAERTIECYRDIVRTIVPDTTKYLLGTKTMAKVEDEIFFQVKQNHGTTIYLKPPERANVVPYDKDPPFNLPRQYEVLEVKGTCLVVAFGPKTNGKQHCMVWGIFNGKNISDSECYDVPSSCTEMYDVWEQPTSDPCATFDVDEERRLKKAQRAEGSIID
uniref:Lipocalin n=1 Tax=Rhipicephalus zambeziensis TaxID=60191 RepID=A0A224YMY1_9ACAR